MSKYSPAGLNTALSGLLAELARQATPEQKVALRTAQGAHVAAKKIRRGRLDKPSAAPVPEGQTRVKRGVSNADERGSSYNRRRRKQFLLDKFGDGKTCECVHCQVTLDFETVTADRIKPGDQGGRYTRDNIQPSCMDCASKQGGRMAGAKRRRRSV